MLSNIRVQTLLETHFPLEAIPNCIPARCGPHRFHILLNQLQALSHSTRIRPSGRPTMHRLAGRKSLQPGGSAAVRSIRLRISLPASAPYTGLGHSRERHRSGHLALRSGNGRLLLAVESVRSDSCVLRIRVGSLCAVVADDSMRSEHRRGTGESNQTVRNGLDWLAAGR